MPRIVVWTKLIWCKRSRICADLSYFNYALITLRGKQTESRLNPVVTPDSEQRTVELEDNFVPDAE